MTNYSFKVSTPERKQVAGIIAESIVEDAKYQGTPTYAYHMGGWTIDRAGTVDTPEIQKDSLRIVLDALKTAGAIVEGNGTVTLSLEGHTGNSIRNLINMIWVKQNLIQKSLARQQAIIPESLVITINAVPIDSLEDFAKVVNDAVDAGQIAGDSDLDFDLAEKTLSFNFFTATLETDEVLAFITLCQQLNEQAKKQKFSSTRQKETGNDKFAMRVWLNRLGFVGDAFKGERKALLARLSGNTAFATEAARVAADDKRKAKHRDAAVSAEGSEN